MTWHTDFSTSTSQSSKTTQPQYREHQFDSLPGGGGVGGGGGGGNESKFMAKLKITLNPRWSWKNQKLTSHEGNLETGTFHCIGKCYYITCSKVVTLI
jgi:hypothetical protein